MIEEKQAKEGLSDEQVDKALELLISISRDGIVGKFSTESIDMALKAINHDADVATAEEEAKIRGKNEKVEETLRKKSKGDGMPNLDGKNRNPEPDKGKRNLGAIERMANESGNIWERGHMKREKYY